MGQKLDANDPFYNIKSSKPVGVSGGCYCCGQQLHVEYHHLNILPNARINGELYQLIICDGCENDVLELEEDGIELVSYDVLFQLQEDLQKRLNELNEMHDVTSEDRFEILKELYIYFEMKYRKLKG